MRTYQKHRVGDRDLSFLNTQDKITSKSDYMITIIHVYYKIVGKTLQNHNQKS